MCVNIHITLYIVSNNRLSNVSWNQLLLSLKIKLCVITKNKFWHIWAIHILSCYLLYKYKHYVIPINALCCLTHWSMYWGMIRIQGNAVHATYILILKMCKIRFISQFFLLQSGLISSWIHNDINANLNKSVYYILAIPLYQ